MWKSVYIPFNIEQIDFQHGTFGMLLGVQLVVIFCFVYFSIKYFVRAMASLKAEKPAGTQLFGQPKKEPAAKASEGASKAAGSKSAAKKSAQKPQEPKKKGKGAKSAAKH